MTKTRAEIAAKNLFEAATVALVCHVNPDGDTVGAALALKAVLEKLSKTAEVFCDDFPYEKLSILQNFEKISCETFEGNSTKQVENREEKENRKNLKKVLDKRRYAWYYIGAVCERHKRESE